MNEQMENMEKELKDSHDEKINKVLRRKPVIIEEKDKRARRKLIYAMNSANKTFKVLGVKPIMF